MYSNQKKFEKWFRRTVIIIMWLMVWQIITMCVDNSILLVGPGTTLMVLAEKVAEISFWKSIFGSLLRILAGFLAGWILGLLLAAVSGCSGWVEEALYPVMSLIKTIPVASFVVLFLIWFRTDILAGVISMFVVLPNVYLNTLEGIKNTDVKLLEMAEVYEIHPLDRFFYIYRPALKPFWESCMKLSIGMSWKSGVAAEVIGTPEVSIGEQLYMSKIYLDTAGVLAWTVVIILISVLCEKVLLGLWSKFLEWQPKCRGVRGGDTVTGEPKMLLGIREVSKSYESHQLFQHFNAEYKCGRIYYFTTPSGSGKTTLFRMIAGLENSDEGEFIRNGKIAYAFQEDRLCESYSALKNVELVCRDEAGALRYLLPLLDKEDLQKPCSQLSGGMKRRAAVARAFAAQRDIVLLDEPFAGLDEMNRKKVLEYIQMHKEGKVVLIATHVQ